MLKIAEVVLRERRKKNLTQEELASALNVSPQAVSNWERGGYPDIELLPRIASFFKITVDELVGFDDVTRQTEIDDFCRRFSSTPVLSQVDFAKEYYAKYPSSFEVCEALALAIRRNPSLWEKNYSLMKEACMKILSECTWEYTRQNALECMCIVCSDTEWENEWMNKSEDFYSCTQNERIEERMWLRGRRKEYGIYGSVNLLLIIQHLLGREYMRYYEKDNTMLFDNPEKTASLMKYRMRVLKDISENGKIPEAWTGYCADLCLKTAGALVGAGDKNAGFKYLEKAFELYRMWLKIPNGKKMETGNPVLFENAKITKTEVGCEVIMSFEDGTEVRTPYLWLFWQCAKDIETAMLSWPWFDGVRNDERFISFLERAKELAQNGE